MREICFRGKRVDNGEWVVGFLEFHLVDGDLTKTKQDAFITYDYMDKIGKVYRDRFDVIPETVGQYTGLKDKNSKEIYEGDVLNITSELLTNFGKTRTGQYDTTYKLVMWLDDEWGCKVLKSKSIVVGSKQGGLIIPAKWGVVIGNIHDNPELLEAN